MESVMPKPMVVTLCGSARFEPWFHMWNEALGLAGHMVFALSSYPSQHDGNKDWYSESEKAVLDAVHLRKIERSDAVVVLNVFGYLGESTRREIAFAEELRKPLYYLESWGEGVVTVSHNHAAWYVGVAARHGVPFGYRSLADTSYRKQAMWVRELFGDAGQVRNAIVDRLLGHKVRLGWPE